MNSVGYTSGPYCEEEEAYVLSFADFHCDKARDFIFERNGVDRRPITLAPAPSEPADTAPTPGSPLPDRTVAVQS